MGGRRRRRRGGREKRCEGCGVGGEVGLVMQIGGLTGGEDGVFWYRR